MMPQMPDIIIPNGSLPQPAMIFPAIPLSQIVMKEEPKLDGQFWAAALTKHFVWNDNDEEL